MNHMRLTVEGPNFSMTLSHFTQSGHKHTHTAEEQRGSEITLVKEHLPRLKVQIRNFL